MSDTIVVMDKGRIQQIGKPEDIYNEPKNAFVADFIGESNILDGVMMEDYRVKFFGRVFQCVDKGFAPNEPVDVVIRPEDIDIVPVSTRPLPPPSPTAAWTLSWPKPTSWPPARSTRACWKRSNFHK